jgi:hypothetical protein
MKALEYIEGQPDVSGVGLVATRGAAGAIADSDEATGVVTLFLLAAQATAAGQRPADPELRTVGSWRATHHADDPAYIPDLWVHQLRDGTTLWVKRDDHLGAGEAGSGACRSCPPVGNLHRDGAPVAVFTVLLPEEW